MVVLFSQPVAAATTPVTPLRGPRQARLVITAGGGYKRPFFWKHQLRSNPKWNKPHADYDLLLALRVQRRSNCDRMEYINTASRDCRVVPEMLGAPIGVWNGEEYKLIFCEERMLNKTLGQLVPIEKVFRPDGASWQFRQREPLFTKPEKQRIVAPGTNDPFATWDKPDTRPRWLRKLERRTREGEDPAKVKAELEAYHQARRARKFERREKHLPGSGTLTRKHGRALWGMFKGSSKAKAQGGS